MRTPSLRSVRVCVVAIVALGLIASFACGGQPAPAPSQNENLKAPPPLSPSVPPWPSTFPAGFPSASVSGQIPLALPDQVRSIENPELARPYFDYFSWQAFIALNWPATAGQRGMPDGPDDPSKFLHAASGVPVVWGTYKTSFDLFGQKDQRPTPWEAFESPMSPCPGAAAGQKTLYLVTKGDTTLDDISQAFSSPLIDQQKNYVYYEVVYDKTQYEFVRGQDADPSTWLYLLKNLVKQEPVQMKPSSSPPSTLGPIMIKAAWRIKTEKDDPTRFYTTTAMVFDPQTTTCTQQTVLLVGLHIAHKVSPFSEWVWSTFEQIDNVPPDAGTTQPPPNGYSFNNGTDDPKTQDGYARKPPKAGPVVVPVDERVPVQVTRLNPIPDTPAGASTRLVNDYYQKLLSGTVWQYYELVVTQWPANPSQFTTMENGGIYPQDAGQAFPAIGAVNTTMETYFQSQTSAAGAGGNSCMSCHYRAGKTDFSWGLQRRAH